MRGSSDFVRRDTDQIRVVRPQGRGKGGKGTAKGDGGQT